jgi:hypothetical protein
VTVEVAPHHSPPSVLPQQFMHRPWISAPICPPPQHFMCHMQLIYIITYLFAFPLSAEKKYRIGLFKYDRKIILITIIERYIINFC